jgi:L-fuconolactonase
MTASPAPGGAVPRVDAHQHFWRYSPADYAWIDDSMAALRRDFLPGDLRPELSEAGFHYSIAVQVRQSLQETAWLLDLADRHPFVAGVVGWADLQSDGVEAQLEKVRHPKLVGIRHIVQSEPDDRFLLRPSFCRGISALRTFGLTYDILIHPRHLPVAAEFAAKFEDQPFVLDHLAKPRIRHREIEAWARDLARLAAAPNVWCKLSGLVTEADVARWRPEDLRPYLDVAFDVFGAGRLMIGSDWPVCTVAGDYRRTMGVVTGYLDGRSPADRAAVLGGNAAGFWKLDLRVPGGRPVPAPDGGAYS